MREYLANRKWVVWFALFLFLVTLVPYFIGFQLQDQKWIFTGFVLGVEDGNSYIAKMLRGSAGAFFFETPYTAYEQNGLLAFFPYTLLGKLAGGSEIHLQLVVLFQAFRLLGCLLMSLATYDLIGMFIDDQLLRRKALIFAMAGGGLGWLAAVGLGNLWSTGLPLEFYSPETFGFLAAFSLPHLAVSRALLLWGLMAFLGNLINDRVNIIKPWIGGLIWLGMGFFQPLAIVTGWAILAGFLALYAAFVLITKKNPQQRDWHGWLLALKYAVIMGLISSPWVIYNFANSLTDPYLQGWAAQNIILSPAATDYLLAFATILPFAVLAGYSYVRNRDLRGLFLLAWVAIFPILAYAPYLLQRRLPEGIWIGLTILGFSWFKKRDAKGQKWVSLLVGLSLLPAIFLELGAISAILNQSEPLYIQRNEEECYRAVQNNAQSDDVVLSSYETGNNLPAWAPVKVIIGHGPESIHLKELQPKVKDIYQESTSSEERKNLISEFNVKYIYWGTHEAILGDWKPSPEEGYDLIYQNSGCEVWKVAGAGQ